jgi:hypothetical protein
LRKDYKILVFLFLLFLAKSTSAQNWLGVGFGRDQFYYPRALFADDINNKLYIGGAFTTVNSFTTFGISYFDGTSWFPMANGLYDVQCITQYNNQIFAGSNFGVFRWNGTQWDTIGKITSGMILSLYVHNNELYAGGVYASISGLNSKGLAKWNGSAWQKVGNFEKVCFGRVNDIKVFNNEIYVFGNILDSLGVPMSVSKYDGLSWQRITNKFNGGLDEIETAEIYNNELYVGGTFGKCYGSIFNFISKYDGLNWSDVGFDGLTGITTSSNGQVHKLRTIDSKLYAVGVFSYADLAPAQYIASWDGAKWCGYGNGFDNRINNIIKFNNDMFISGNFWKYQTDSIFKLAKWNGGTFVDTCSNPLSVSELHNFNSVKIYPNPVSNTLHIDSKQYFEAGTTIEITNMLGQTVLKLPYSNEIDVSNISNGCYILQITTSDNQRLYSKFVKQ